MVKGGSKMEAKSQTLSFVLAQLRERIGKIQRRGQIIGEQNTKAVLIEPLLSALGWNLIDLSEVIREYKCKPQDRPVDYALFILRSPSLFVEAKDLRADLSDRKWVSQILSYATVAGVEWCVLTNGDEYRLYNAHAPVEVEEKLFRIVRISELSQDEYALRTLDLLTKDKMGEKRIDALWKAHFVDRHVKLALERILTSESRNLVRWIHKRRPELSPSEIRESLKRADIQVEFPLITPHFPQAEHPEPESKRLTTLVIHVSDLIEVGLINAPLELEKQYKGVRLVATVLQDGRIMFDGQSYNSLSTAAGMARESVIGAPRGRKYPQTNGWTFWKYRDPETGDLKDIDVLRKAYPERRQGG